MVVIHGQTASEGFIEGGLVFDGQSGQLRYESHQPLLIPLCSDSTPEVGGCAVTCSTSVASTCVARFPSRTFVGQPTFPSFSALYASPPAKGWSPVYTGAFPEPHSEIAALRRILFHF